MADSDRAQQLFQKALEHDPAERAAFLEDLRVSDPSLLQQVESLLARHSPQSNSEQLENESANSPTASVTRVDTDSDSSSDTQRIGPYHILREIGQGGMGVVYEAEQQEPVHRRVALKLIKLGMDTKQVIARFESERQALALMNHPNIAGVYDAGSTKMGRPYFAMEYVQGISITEYCDTHRLSISERLELFTHVCNGIQHAHQKGIIHRDIKPSNVLVTIQDDRPQPKLIDFGVSKAVSQRLTEKTLYTELGQPIGTPEYMSPEQAEMTNLDIDTRTDVYTLGVLLYELLTGTRPFDSKTLKEAGFDEFRRAIREEEPAKPSTRIATLGDDSAAAAQRRQMEPRTLQRQLRGELDWITMRALEKDRTRRYETANALALDVQRYLNQEPIRASAPGASYRVRKFVSRHKVGVFAAAAVLAALVVGLLVATAALLQAREAERRTANEAATAERVTDFLVGLFYTSDPSEAQGNRITAREILDKGAQEIDETLADEPELQGRLMGVMGTVYTGLGLYSDAEPLLEGAVQTRRSTLGGSHPQTLAVMIDLANVYWHQGRLDEAEALYLEVVESRNRALGEDHPDTLRANWSLASVFIRTKRYEEAERLSLAVLDSQNRLLGNKHPDTIATMNNLGSLYYAAGRYDEAEPIAAKVLQVRRSDVGDLHPLTLLSVHNLATIYDRQGRYLEAEAFFREAIDGKLQVLGDAHPETIQSTERLAMIYQKLERFEEAETLLLGAKGALESALGSDHKRTQSIVTRLVELYDTWGQPEEAQQLRSPK